MWPLSASALIEARPTSVSAPCSMATNANETRATDIKKRRNVKRRCMVTFQRLFAAHRSCRFTLALPRSQGALHCFDVETDRDNSSHSRRLHPRAEGAHDF